MMLRPDHPVLTDVHLRKELLERGFNDRAIARAVADGLLAKVRHGSYVDGEAWRQLDASGRHGVAARAVARRAGTPVYLSHSSPLPLRQLPTWGLDLTDVHVTRVDGKAGRKEAGVRQHRGRTQKGDVEELYGVPVASLPRNLIELSTIASVEACLCVWNDALHRKLTTAADIEARYEASKENSHPMDHWPNTLKTDLLLRLADPRIESVGESRTLFVCWQCNLPMPIPQHEVRDGRGTLVARLDFAFPDLGVWLEFDGKVKYTTLLREDEQPSDVVLREKAREDLVRELTGWICVRISWEDLRTPQVLAQRIRDAFHAAAAHRARVGA